MTLREYLDPSARDGWDLQKKQVNDLTVKCEQLRAALKDLGDWSRREIGLLSAENQRLSAEIETLRKIIRSAPQYRQQEHKDD